MNQVEDKLSVVHVPIDDLRPDPANPRRISDAELESLTRSIRQFGFVDPVIARLDDKTVIGGHQRLLAARRLGLASVPVILVDLPAEQARLLNLALKPHIGLLGRGAARSPPGRVGRRSRSRPLPVGFRR